MLSRHPVFDILAVQWLTHPAIEEAEHFGQAEINLML